MLQEVNNSDLRSALGKIAWAPIVGVTGSYLLIFVMILLPSMGGFNQNPKAFVIISYMLNFLAQGIFIAGLSQASSAFRGSYDLSKAFSVTNVFAITVLFINVVLFIMMMITMGDSPSLGVVKAMPYVQLVSFIVMGIGCCVIKGKAGVIDSMTNLRGMGLINMATLFGAIGYFFISFVMILFMTETNIGGKKPELMIFLASIVLMLMLAGAVLWIAGWFQARNSCDEQAIVFEDNTTPDAPTSTYEENETKTL